MQHRPDHPTLLEALARFLLSDVAPKLEADKALQFRALIAANLASVVAQELRTEGPRFADEVERLRALLPAETAAAADALQSGDRQHRLQALASLDRVLAEKLRAGAFDAAGRNKVFAHLMASARATLQVTNPRFELGDDV
jgi:hypothetical protein